MNLGFADEIGHKDGVRYAVIWMTVDSVEDAKNCHSSIRNMPLVAFDPDDFVIYPNRAYRMYGNKNGWLHRQEKNQKWHRILTEPVHV